MPVLSNHKWEIFAQELAKGKTADQAYVDAGYRQNSGNAVTLKGKQSISNRVRELLEARDRMHAQSTAKAVERASLTKEWIIAGLMENAERALQAVQAKNANGDPVGDFKYEGSVANRAFELLGKELGMFIDRKETGAPGEFAELDSEGIRRAIAERLGMVGSGDEAPRMAGTEGIGGSQSRRVH